LHGSAVIQALVAISQTADIGKFVAGRLAGGHLVGVAAQREGVSAQEATVSEFTSLGEASAQDTGVVEVDLNGVRHKTLSIQLTLGQGSVATNINLSARSDLGSLLTVGTAVEELSGTSDALLSVGRSSRATASLAPTATTGGCTSSQDLNSGAAVPPSARGSLHGVETRSQVRQSATESVGGNSNRCGR